MAQEQNTRYITVSLTLPARSALQSGALQFSAKAGRRLTMSDVVIAALAVAEAHPDEVVERLDEEDESEGDGMAKAS